MMGQTKEQRIIKQLTNPTQPVLTPIATDMFIPNHSGTHDAGILLKTPSKDIDLVNKKYVDDSIAAIDYSGFVPYTGATTDVDLGEFNLKGDLVRGNDLMVWDESANGDLTLLNSAGTKQFSLTQGDVNAEINAKDTPLIIKSGSNDFEFIEDSLTPKSLEIYLNGTNPEIYTSTGQLDILGNVTADNLSIDDWNTAFSWGDHASEGYLTAETDPVYLASSWASTTNNSGNWDTAYSWGDHATEGYLTSITAHAASHAVGGTDSILPADPDADKFLMWDDSASSLVWADAGGTYTDEMAQDAVGGMIADTDTINMTYTDGTPELKADAKVQMSITSDASGLKLSGDSATPGNSKLYGTNSSGTKGWYDQPTGSSSSAITTDTTFYIATTGDDTTGDGTAGTPWATPNKAFTYLKDYTIYPGVLVTISVAAGVYTLASVINVVHPQSRQIKLIGEAPEQLTMSTINSTAGTAGTTKTYVITVNDNSNCSVDDWVMGRYFTGGTYPMQMAGVHKITAVGASNQITINNKHKRNLSASGNVTGYYWRMKTVFDCTSSTNGIKVEYGNALHTIKNIMLFGNSTGTGISLMDVSASADQVQQMPGCYIGFDGFVGVALFDFGINNRGGDIRYLNGNDGFVATSSCDYFGTIVRDHGTMYFDGNMTPNFVTTGNNSRGLSVEKGGRAYVDSGVAIGNQTYGVYVMDGSVANMDNGKNGYNNSAYNAYVNKNSEGHFDTTIFYTCGTDDIYANSNSRVYAVSATLPDGTSPAVNTLGNDNSYIDG